MLDSLGGQCKDWAPFLLRLGLGVIFLIQGCRDVSHLSSSPSLRAVVTALIAVVGGLLVLIGLLTRWASAAIAGLVVYWIVDGPQLAAFTRWDAQFYFAYLVMALALFCLGGGPLSVDLRQKRKQQT
jgi:uncharacterized membrane protein YphA (DoxX/SURF4 family)